MTNDEIKTLALSCGFTERLQDNGEMDLNTYVYVSHKKAYDKGFIDGLTATLTMLKSKNAEFYSEILDLKFALEQDLEFGVTDENAD